MDRADWLACDDPARMLEWLTSDWAGGVHIPYSDRKLRLFVEAAACDLCHVSGMSPAEQAVYVAGASCGTQAGKAALLREVVGDPFLPRLSCDRCPRCTTDDMTEREGRALRCHGCEGEFPLHSWLSGTVLALAQAAYDERGGRECDHCRGRGRVYDYRTNKLPGDTDCWICHGTGRVEDGTLDPVCLMAVADALEEAGCDSEPLLRHLRGQEGYCHACGGTGEVDNGDSEPHPCAVCPPAQGPHVRGCWVLDLLLGKS